jgi:hypothetical protein
LCVLAVGGGILLYIRSLTQQKKHCWSAPLRRVRRN